MYNLYKYLNANCLAFILVVLFGCVIPERLEAKGEIPAQLSFVSAVSEDDPITKWGILIHTEALKRMGIGFKFIEMPAKRAGISVNKGMVDGEMGRVADYNTMYPNLIRVDEHNRYIKFLAFGTNPAIELDGWNSLKNTAYFVEYRRGVKKCAEQLPLVVAPERLSEINTIEQAVKKLLTGRTDIFIGVDFLMMRTIRTPWFQEVRHKTGKNKSIHPVGFMEKITIHTWLYKTHRKLVSKFADVLREMKVEGLFEAYREQVGIPTAELTW